jgi:hypothetical protein
VSSIAITVDAFQVRLWDATRALLDEAGTTAVIPPDGAWFVVSAASGDLRGVVSCSKTKRPDDRHGRGGRGFYSSAVRNVVGTLLCGEASTYETTLHVSEHILSTPQGPGPPPGIVRRPCAEPPGLG